MSAANGVVVHITTESANDWQQAIRNVSNLYQDDSLPLPAETITVVANGEAVRFLLRTAPEADQVTRITGAGIRVEACARSLNRQGYSPKDLADGVETVTSGVAEVVRLQWKGNGYLKLP